MTFPSRTSLASLDVKWAASLAAGVGAALVEFESFSPIGEVDGFFHDVALPAIRRERPGRSSQIGPAVIHVLSSLENG
ncbi:MAG: hypothetical protein AAGK78_08790, partial [Planctomycetota bacterium]